MMGKFDKYLLILVIGTVFLTLFVGTDDAEGISDGLKSWSQKITSGRFVVLSQFNYEAVLDKETQLVWEKSPDTATSTWEDAFDICSAKSVGERKGWRLPTLSELSSLVDPTKTDPALPSGHPFRNVITSFYWSASVWQKDQNWGQGVRFYDGNIHIGTKDNQFYVWCVRGGQGVDAQ